MLVLRSVDIHLPSKKWIYQARRPLPPRPRRIYWRNFSSPEMSPIRGERRLLPPGNPCVHTPCRALYGSLVGDVNGMIMYHHGNMSSPRGSQPTVTTALSVVGRPWMKHRSYRCNYRRQRERHRHTAVQQKNVWHRHKSSIERNFAMNHAGPPHFTTT